jgi:putative PIN family toxin of toxin-antitoxin system
MKVLTDTNILISAMLYPNGTSSRALLHAANYHDLYLSDYNISELREVVEQKFPDKMAHIDAFLAKFTYSLVIAPISPEKLISDPKDAPILNAAIIEDVDLIISGDKHFRELSLKRPVVVTVAEFLDIARV